MEIDTEPVFKLPPEDVLPIDIQLCLSCQLSEAIKLVKKPFQIANILDNLKLREHHEIRQYSEINKRVDITGQHILIRNYNYNHYM